jgi:hypothetical protein
VRAAGIAPWPPRERSTLEQALRNRLPLVSQ